MIRIRFQGSLPHAGDSQPFWAPRAKERRPIFEGSLTVVDHVTARSFGIPTGYSATGTPASSNALTFDSAVPRFPWMIAPAWPIRFPGGAVLRRAAYLADDDDSFRLAVFLEHRERVHHARADDRVPADPDAGRLSETGIGHGVHDLVGQRPAAGDDARVALPEQLVWHDSHLRLAGRGESGAVGSDDGATAAAGVRHHVQAIVERDSFGDDDDELESA